METAKIKSAYREALEDWAKDKWYHNPAEVAEGIIARHKIGGIPAPKRKKKRNEHQPPKRKRRARANWQHKKEVDIRRSKKEIEAAMFHHFLERVADAAKAAFPHMNDLEQAIKALKNAKQ